MPKPPTTYRNPTPIQPQHGLDQTLHRQPAATVQKKEEQVGTAETSPNASSFIQNISNGAIPSPNRPAVFDEAEKEKTENRASTGFEINGLPSQKNQESDQVYFDNSSAEVQTEQEEKIKQFLIDHPSTETIYLYGSSSEEGKNDALIEKRLQITADLLEKNAGQSLNIEKIPFPDYGKGKPRYRRFRTVIMKAKKTTFEKEKGFVEGRTCGISEQKILDNAIQAVTYYADNAYRKVQEYKNDPNSHLDVELTVKGYLGNVSEDTVDEVLEVLHQFRNFLFSVEANTFSCGDDSYTFCDTPIAVGNQDKEKVMFCPSFFQATDTVFRERVLMHEIMHVIPNKLEDLSYAKDRAFRFVRGDVAMNNADNLTYLIVKLNELKMTDPRGRNTREDPHKDDYTNCPKNTIRLSKYLAEAEYWAFDSLSWVKHIYLNPDRMQSRRDMIRSHFGPISQADLAGVIDRVSKIRSILRKNLFTFTCNDFCFEDSTVSISQALEFSICPEFFDLGKSEGIKELIKATLPLIPEIPEKQYNAYPEIMEYFSDGVLDF